MKYNIGDRFRLENEKGNLLTCVIKNIFPGRLYPYIVLFEDGTKDSFTEEGLNFGKKLDPIPLYSVMFVTQEY